MTNASDVLLAIGSELSGHGVAEEATPPAAPTPTEVTPAVVCGKCDTIHTGADIHRVECTKCNSNLLANGMYIGGACPYAVDCPIPYGKCHCGCGEATVTYTYAHPKEGVYLGAKARFLKFHGGRVQGSDLQFVELRTNRKARVQKPKNRSFVVSPVQAVLTANPGRMFTTQELARRAKVTPKQASTAFSTLKINDPSYQGTMGYHTYSPSDTAPTPTPPAQWPHQRDGLKSHRRDFPGVLVPGQRVEVSPEARELYEAFEKAADHNGRVSSSAVNVLKGITYRKVGAYNAQQRLTELHNVGCVDATNNRVKYLLQHPDGEPFVPADPDHPLPMHYGRADAPRPQRQAAPPRPLPVRTDPYVHAEQAMQAIPNVEEIDEEKLGTALAKLMWERYEWALAEVGRLHEVVAEQKERLDRAEALLAEQPVNISSIARRFLTDPRN